MRRIHLYKTLALLCSAAGIISFEAASSRDVQTHVSKTSSGRNTLCAIPDPANGTRILGPINARDRVRSGIDCRAPMLLITPQ